MNGALYWDHKTCFFQKSEPLSEREKYAKLYKRLRDLLHFFSHENTTQCQNIYHIPFLSSRPARLQLIPMTKLDFINSVDYTLI